MKSAPSLERLSSIREDGSRKTIHPADVKGRFVTKRRVVYTLLIAFYLVLPFLRVGGQPALFLDIEGRRFFLLGATFNAQDFWLVIFLLTFFGFGLLFVTAWLGRIWCGWACPQTVFLEGVYRPIERFFDGPRVQRMRMQEAPWNLNKTWRRVAKHLVYILVSLGLAHVFLSLFVSIPSLVQMMQGHPREHWVAFLWVMSAAGLLYFNFAWFREQLCIVVCPYGRLQSALIDDHSLIIGYDKVRGEPRGKIRKERHPLPQVPSDAPLLRQETSSLDADLSPTPALAPLGDCIDCNRCVVVCPTGIDIRHGLQMECIGCAQCVDACDEVMMKVGRDPGLIRYDSLAGLAGEKKRLARPRLYLYGALLLIASTGLFLGLSARKPFEANLLRVRGVPYVLAAPDIRNQFELHLVNKNPSPSILRIELSSPVEAIFTTPSRAVELGSLESFRLPIFVSVPQEEFSAPFDVSIRIEDSVSSTAKTVTGRFLGPPNGRPAPTPSP